jgi:pimeloyl-ACP methyl ester carboxylesterase
MNPKAPGSYMFVNDLNMYYEDHGAGGTPLVLLHGGLGAIHTSFEKVLPAFAKTRRVIAIEQQGHGHTADIDRPLTFEQMGADTAAVLRRLGIERADFLGYSDGGNVAVAVAVRYPALVRKLVLAGVNFDNDGLTPEFLEFLRTATPADLGDEFRDSYAKVAPRPSDWPTLVAKFLKMNAEFAGWPPDQVRAIAAPTLIMIGDRDFIRPEHAIATFSLLRDSQLAILPGTNHETLMTRNDWLVPMMRAFLDPSGEA